MARYQDTYPALMSVLPARPDGPYWREVLEDRWRKRLEEVTELSIAYHGAAASGPGGGWDGRGHLGRLLRRAVAARRKLADTDDALARLAAGKFGRCEQCGSLIPDGMLAAIPETRYCPRCDAPQGWPAFADGPAARGSR